VAIQQIIAVPQVTFCNAATYAANAAPPDCQQVTGAANFAPNAQHRLYVLADPAKLAQAMVSAVVVGICYFEPGDQKVSADVQHIDALCTVMRDFQASETAPVAPPNGSGSATGSATEGSPATKPTKKPAR
jgi:hypothetical protein